MRLLSLVPVLVACHGDDETRDSGPVEIVTVTGTGTEFGFAVVLGEEHGVCVQVRKPDGFGTAREEVASDGTFAIDAPIGNSWLIFDDCDGIRWAPTAHRLADVLRDAIDGDTVDAGRLPVMSESSWVPLRDSYEAAGGLGEPQTNGAMLGAIAKASGGSAPDTVLACGCGEHVYYADRENADGLFTGPDGNNTATVESITLYLAAPAPEGTWQASGPSGSSAPTDTGAWPGMLVIEDFAVE